MSDSTQTVPGEAETRLAYQAFTLRLARERVTDDRPLRVVTIASGDESSSSSIA